VKAFDAQVLQTDPAVIALGTSEEPTLESARNNPNGPACEAARSAFRNALIFKTVFTAFVAALSAITLLALGWVVYKVIADAFDATGTLAAIAAVVSGGGALYLGRQRAKDQTVLDATLAKVGEYCGGDLRDELA